MSYIDPLSMSDVVDAETLAEFARQTLGLPLFRRDINALKGAARELFELNPRADWQTLACTVQWCKAKRLRPHALVGIVGMTRHAWADGVLPELDRTDDQQLENDIAEAMSMETDPWWRQVLLASGGQARLRNFRRWRTEREHLYRKATA